jgi:hypothetical protein
MPFPIRLKRRRLATGVRSTCIGEFAEQQQHLAIKTWIKARRWLVHEDAQIGKQFAVERMKRVQKKTIASCSVTSPRNTLARLAAASSAPCVARCTPVESKGSMKQAASPTIK